MREELLRNGRPGRDRSVTVFWACCSVCERHKAINHEWTLTYQGGVLIQAICGDCAESAAQECLRLGGQYARLAMAAESEQEWLEWRGFLLSRVESSREDFGPDTWVSKELEGLLHDVSMRDWSTGNGKEAAEGRSLPEDRLGQ